MDTTNKLRTARLDAGLTQRQAADLVHVDTSTWSRIENGKQLPPREVVAKIMDLLNLDAESILFPQGRDVA